MGDAAIGECEEFVFFGQPVKKVMMVTSKENIRMFNRTGVLPL
jgi:hypothetical protein